MLFFKIIKKRCGGKLAKSTNFTLSFSFVVVWGGRGVLEYGSGAVLMPL